MTSQTPSISVRRHTSRHGFPKRRWSYPALWILRLPRLAHPFRVFQGRRPALISKLAPALARLLKENNVAAEINYHNVTPSKQLIKACLEAGTKLTLGSDSHTLAELGEFWPHLRLLESCGYNGDPADILVDPTRPEQSTA